MLGALVGTTFGISKLAVGGVLKALVIVAGLKLISV